MNSMQKSYRSFVESVCKQFDCMDAIRPLQEGFAALCEASGRNPLTSERLAEFHELVMETVKPIMERINRFLKPCGLSIVLDYSDESREHFEDEPNHVAAIMHSLQDEASVAPVAINESMIAEYYYGAWYEDDNILEHCLSDTLWHEAGHHVVDTAVDILLNGDSQDDEDIVESFGRYMTEKTLGYDSDYDTEMVNKAIGAVTLLKILNSGTYSKESLKNVMAFAGNELTEQELAERLQECGVQEKTGNTMEGKSNSLCESDTGDTRNGSAWDTVERIHVYHAADPSLNLDINLNSLWKVRQKNSVTRDDVVRTFIEDAMDLNKWKMSTEDGGAVITSASIKFKGEPDAITVDIPCPAGVDDLVSSVRSSLQESACAPGAPEIPGSFRPTTGAQAKVDTKLRQLGIVVDWSSYNPCRNRSWASQGMPTGAASAYTVSEAEKAGSYNKLIRQPISFYASVSELAKTPLDKYDVNTSMDLDCPEIGVDIKFVPPETLMHT